MCKKKFWMSINTEKKQGFLSNSIDWGYMGPKYKINMWLMFELRGVTNFIGNFFSNWHKKADIRNRKLKTINRLSEKK